MRDWNKEIPGWFYREAAKQRPKSKVLDFFFCSGPVYIQMNIRALMEPLSVWEGALWLLVPIVCAAANWKKWFRS